MIVLSDYLICHLNTYITYKYIDSQYILISYFMDHRKKSLSAYGLIIYISVGVGEENNP